MAVHRLMAENPVENPDFGTTYARLIRAAAKKISGQPMIGPEAERLADCFPVEIYHYTPVQGLRRVK